jgi:preprotein translocase subunit SecA
LQIIDQRWREHLYDMDYLREGIHLRGFAQIDPLVAYKNEAFELFSDLMSTIWSDFARMVFNVPVEIEEAGGQENVVPEQPRNAPGAGTTPGRVTYSGGGDAQPSALTAAAAANGGQATYTEEEELLAAPVEQRRLNPDEQIGRNDPCWCGSGKKYKKCHGS